jgi:nitrate/nitrite-specific signal transduction histidine kinase
MMMASSPSASRTIFIASVIVLAVKDFGVGLPAKPSNSKGIGLRMMQYRAGVIGGTLLVQRNSTEGTTVVCTVHGGGRNRDANVVSKASPVRSADADN